MKKISCYQRWKTEDPERYSAFLARVREYNQEPERRARRIVRDRARRNANIPKTLWHIAKRRAAEKGTEFSIRWEDLIVPERCPIFDIPIGLLGEKNAPSLDRVDNSKGYVEGNVRVISRMANVWKSNHGVETAERFLKYVKSV